MTSDMLNLFLSMFVTFFVLIDAIGVAPIFASLTSPGGPAHARSMAIRSVMVASIIITGFAFGGAWLLNAMHISIDAFRAAGGLLLFLIAIDMVFEKRTERRENKAEAHIAEHTAPDDVSVFPLGIPMLAGPGSIATAILYMQNAENVTEKGLVIAAILANLVICLIIFLAAGPLLRAMGTSIAGAITRILGVILAALSVQLVLDGIKGSFGIA